MPRILLACASLALMVVAGSATAMPGPMNGQMAKPMHTSKTQMKTMRMCEGMDHDKMMKTKKCMAMMKMRPDMMKSGAAMSDGMATKQ